MLSETRIQKLIDCTLQNVLQPKSVDSNAAL
jgi:hypothetical protein